MKSSDKTGLVQNSSNPPENLELNDSKPIIAVTMATSRQGYSVVKHLSKSGIFHIRALTRFPSSQKSEKLSRLDNVQIVKADLLEPETLERCFSGVYGIFGNTTPTKGWVLGRGSMVRDYEIKQGRNLIDIAKKFADLGTLKHFIFSSICKPKDPLKSHPAPGHFTSKWSIEEYILKQGLKELSTILRPVSYYENFNSDLPGIKISERIFPGVVHKNKIWQTIAVDDIGLWANAIFKNPQKFQGEALNIAGEEMTGEEMATLWQQLKGQDSPTVSYVMIPRRVVNLIEHDIGLMANWIERTGYGADLKQLKSLADELQITMTPLVNWLKHKDSQSRVSTHPYIFDLPRKFEALSS